MSRHIFFLATLFLLPLTSCGEKAVAHEPTPLIVHSEVVAAEVFLPTYDEMMWFGLQIETENHVLAIHEPAEGTFLGAYIDRDIASGSIRSFETNIGVNHAIFAHTMMLGDEYPLRWVLENIAAMKMPLIVLMPPIDSAWDDIELLTEFAYEAGRFDIPMFVNLYPILEGHGFTPLEYISFFQEAHGTFAEYAPNVALVWGFDAHSLSISTQFFPKTDFVDWVHLMIHDNVDAQGEFGDFFAHIYSFHSAFQQETPLMVSLAVSHYTLENNRYFIHEAAARIDYIYNRLQQYPRIRAVIYRNYNDLQGRGNKYIINSAQEISEAYALVTALPHFSATVMSGNRDNETAILRLHSPFMAVMHNSRFYIPKQALMHDVNFAYLELLQGKEIEIEGELFYSMADIHRILGMDFFVDMAREILVLR
ncbi:MAG: hypothetical protein FWE34_06725 [Defluviitaleaceae bacterium]|nr:hypothetical protein [Defluviitaleaceae bacterium]